MAHVVKRAMAGRVRGEGRRIGIVVSRFNEVITKQLLAGATDTLLRHGVKERDIKIVWVPGAFEIPQAALALARSKRCDALIGLGVVIRGETPHFEYVSQAATQGLVMVTQQTGVPVGFGVLTTNTVAQAMARACPPARSRGRRAGLKNGNKGRDAALAALEMASLLRGLK